MINPCADGVIFSFLRFVTPANMGIVELKISLANESTMVNSSKSSDFVIGSEGGTEEDCSNTCLLVAGVKNTLCEAIVIPSDRNRRGKLGSAYSGI